MLDGMLEPYECRILDGVVVSRIPAGADPVKRKKTLEDAKKLAKGVSSLGPKYSRYRRKKTLESHKLF